MGLQGLSWSQLCSLFNLCFPALALCCPAHPLILATLAMPAASCTFPGLASLPSGGTTEHHLLEGAFTVRLL